MSDRIVPALSVVIPTFNNVKILAECLESWETFAADQPVELIVIEDGCRDDTPQLLERVATTAWGQRHLRWVHETNVHELMCTNRGLREATAPLLMTWQDDMFLATRWLIPELLRTFGRHADIGLLCLIRGINYVPCDGPIATWNDLVDWNRLQSTIGPAPLNWFRIQEVDAVVRPWVVRRECLDRVGLLDEGFRPTCWDESDLAYRIRQAGWRIATHGYERVGAFRHLGSSTVNLNLDQDLRNGRLFFSRWDATIRAEASRVRRRWWRSASAEGWRDTLVQLWAFARPWRRRAILGIEPPR